MIHDVYWAVPLRVIMQNGLPRTFEGIYETLDFLEEEWPFKGGKLIGGRSANAVAPSTGKRLRLLRAKLFWLPVWKRVCRPCGPKEPMFASPAGAGRYLRKRHPAGRIRENDIISC